MLKDDGDDEGVERIPNTCMHHRSDKREKRANHMRPHLVVMRIRPQILNHTVSCLDRNQYHYSHMRIERFLLSPECQSRGEKVEGDNADEHHFS